MMNSDKKNYMLMAWLLIAGSTICRILYAQSFPLAPDETNYWQWSRHLAWGYHDQSPMIAWAIRFFTNFLGHTELAVRLPSILSMSVASVYMVQMARHWFSAKIAWHTALLTQSVFIFNAGALLATADGIQGMAWAASSYYVGRGFEDHRWRHWIAGGLWFGFGLLSKYTMVLFLPFVFVFGLLRCRKRLAAFRPYIGCAMGLCMFIPVILWNAENDWNSVRHVAYLGGANERFVLHFKYFAEYMGSQAGLMSPLVFGLICAGWIWVMRRWREDKKWIYDYLLFTSLPMIAGFALLSLHTRVYGNWPCAGYLTASVLAAALWSQYREKSEAPLRQGTRRYWLWIRQWLRRRLRHLTIGSSYALTITILVHAIAPIFPVSAKIDRTAYEIHGWRQLGARVADMQQKMPRVRNTFIFGVRYQLASELAFYVPGNPMTVSINRWNRPNVYDYWWKDEDLLGQDAVGVIRKGDSRAKLRQVFETVDSPEPFHIYPKNSGGQDQTSVTPVRTLYIYRCYGFKGGLRWKAPNQKDIRVSTSTAP